MTEPTAARLPALDLLRFSAAIAVTLYHYVTCYPAPADAALAPIAAVSAVTRYGYLGVDLFFMISGFVILWSSLGRTAVDFVVSRVSRLYPAFWASIVFAALSIVVLGGLVAGYQAPPLDARTVAANATMLPSMLGATRIEDVYWTLEIEIRFYALIFLLLVLRQMRFVELWLYAWLAASVAGLFIELPWIIKFAGLMPYGPFFIAGGLFYLTYSRGIAWHRSLGLAVCAAACAYISIGQRSQFVTPDAISGWVVPALVLCFFGLFARLVLRRAVPASAPDKRTGNLSFQLGELTYSLYLTHATFGLLVYQLLRPHLGVGPALLVITLLALLVAWAMTAAVDRPSRKPLSRLLYRLAATLRLHKPAAPVSATK
jgi:peptidoglycan/LPS O-acetylase OafA/YrhL